MELALVVTFLFPFADWFAVARQNKTLEYIFKPAAMLTVISLALVIAQGQHDPWQVSWFLVGFVCSLFGDIFLMLSNPRWFVLGLSSFLLAHACYIIGLNPTLPAPAALLVLVAWGSIVGWIVRRIISSLRATNHSSLVLPVVAYGVAMTLMVSGAWATLFRVEWNDTRRVIVIVGATLFLISDGMLAWNRFVKPFAAARLGVIVTYHVGQIALALSMAA